MNLITSDSSVINKEDQYFQFSFAIGVLEQVNDENIETLKQRVYKGGQRKY